MQSTWVHPSLWRVVAFALIIGLLANILLFWVSGGDDWFANVIALASGLTAVCLVVSWYWVKARRFLDDLLVIAFAIWVANIIEFSFQDGAPLDSKLRQCGLYGAEALLALGAYVAHRTANTTNE